MNRFSLFLLIIVCNLCPVLSVSAQKNAEQAIAENLDLWHQAAAEANYNTYFGLMTKSAVFVGTDAGEHWQLNAFKTFAKPFFDKGKAWDFKALDRHVYVYKDQSVAWFDELLDTWMGICRGSGVMKLENTQWKIEHYVLSVAVPNSLMNDVVSLKNTEDKEILKGFRTGE